MAMSLRIDDIGLFVRIVELGTLSAAARERDMPVSQATRMLARLEAAAGARLLHRGTHGLSLTEEGEIVMQHGRRLLDGTAELQGELSGKAGGPSGWVRLSVSPVLAQAVITPSLPELYRKHPQLHMDLCADDRIVDMAREGIDIALRTGTTHTDTVVARQIALLGRGLYAAPAYVAALGLPATPDDLERHQLIGNSGNAALNRWVMVTDTGTASCLSRATRARTTRRWSCPWCCRAWASPAWRIWWHGRWCAAASWCRCCPSASRCRRRRCTRLCSRSATACRRSAPDRAPGGMDGAGADGIGARSQLRGRRIDADRWRSSHGKR